jgi:glycerol-1-phosphatase
VTNNASRTPDSVADHLGELGIEATADEVVTSSQAAATLLADRVEAGARIFVIGGEGLFVALREAGLRPVQDLQPAPAAVVSGYHPDLRWRTVIDGAILVRQGLPWVASNTDSTVPTPAGPGPGNGVLVKAVADYAGRSPEVAGKPQPPLFREAQRRIGGDRLLVVGDRLDTDIEGAVNSGFDSLLVLTGVTGLAELVSATPGQRPTYLSSRLEGLLTEHAQASDGRCGGWTASIENDRLVIAGEGSMDDWWRAIATAAWAHLDAHGRAASVEGLTAPGSVGSPS